MSKSALAPTDIYLHEATQAFGRVLSSLAREDGYQATAGSFDRTWWCWKFTDFSAARFQEGIYTLCWMLARPDTHQHNQEHLIQLIDKAGNFWAKLQHKNGAFDEAYPYEYSLAATAFTCFYIGEGLALSKDHLPEKTQQILLKTIQRAAQWLADNGEYHGVLSNHLAAAAGALNVAYRLTGHKDFEVARNRYLEQIWTHQNNDEGWMLEYGGADPGYQSHGLFYLAQIYATSDPATKRRMHAPLEKALHFQKFFLHPDATFGGEYASRGTCFAFPAAFEILANEFSDACTIAQHLHDFIANKKAISVADMDRWNLFPMLNNYLFAAQAAQNNTYTPKAPLIWQEKTASQHFPNAGIYLHKKDNLFTVLSDLGGTIKQWDTKNQALIYSDCGYLALDKNKIYSSQNRAQHFEIDKDKITVESIFTSLPQTVMSPFKFMLFRGFTTTLGRFPQIAKKVKNLLVKILINNKKPIAIKLKREIDLSIGLEINDQITGLSKDVTLTATAHNVPVHMGSARYVSRHFALLPPIKQPTFDKAKGTATRHIECAQQETQENKAA
jgi:hypothetical protein